MTVAELLINKLTALEFNVFKLTVDKFSARKLSETSFTWTVDKLEIDQSALDK